MSTSARSRLAVQAAAAGYPAAQLEQIAQATLRGYAGQQLNDTQLDQVTAAVEVLAQAGHTAHNIEVLVGHYQRQHGERWREVFWRRALRTAALRYRHPELYGVSPCEPDPARVQPPAPPATPTA